MSGLDCTNIHDGTFTTCHSGNGIKYANIQISSQSGSILTRSYPYSIFIRYTSYDPS